MIQIGPRIDEKTAEWLREKFKTLNAGSEYALGAFRALNERALCGLRGKFERGELYVIIAVFNTTVLMAGLAGQHLVTNCVDGMILDGLDKEWGVDKAAFLKKLKRLSLLEAAALEIWANGFWYGGRHKDGFPGGALDEYVEKML